MSVLERCLSNGWRSYRGFDIKDSLAIQTGHLELSVLERCPSYGMSVLRRFYCTRKSCHWNCSYFFQICHIIKILILANFLLTIRFCQKMNLQTFHQNSANNVSVTYLEVYLYVIYCKKLLEISRFEVVAYISKKSAENWFLRNMEKIS